MERINSPITMITAILGSRNFNNYPLLSKVLSQYQISEVICGDAKGAEALGVWYAAENNLPRRMVEGNGFTERQVQKIRHETMIDQAEQIIAFWDGKSRGTAQALSYARKQGKIIHLVSFQTSN
ncbi:MAG: hypothetical protein V4714_02560 [Bacteroidota bacterium]